MSEINNDDIKEILYGISKSIIIPKYKKLKKDDIKLKNNTDLVTSVDVEVEKNLKNTLTKLLPNSLFVGEESYFENPKIINSYDREQFCWTVDPIDGTSNFVRGDDKFAIMIGLTYRDKIIQSWIYKPLTGEFCYSKMNEGSFINDVKFIITKKTRISESVGSIAFKRSNDIYLQKLIKIKHKFKDVNSYGCIGFEYIDIVKGVRDFSILSKLTPWDHIPGVLFLKEANGSILHYNKSEYSHIVSKSDLVIANSNILLSEIINLIEG
jgi:fructose-1,6-bisphosphatase/inositol monophosphatase family enzyme